MEKIEWNGEYYANFFEAEGEGPGGQKLRSWDDARKYGFLSAGGARCYWHPLLMLSPGDRVWVKMKHKDGTKGFVGCCIVNAGYIGENQWDAVLFAAAVRGILPVKRR